MSDFPKGGDVETTRLWLDGKGFRGLCIDWEADAILGKSDEYIKYKFASSPESQDQAERLCGLLTTARQIPSPDGVGCSKKNIFVVVPLTEKNGEAEVISVPMSSEKDLESFCKLHRGSLLNSSKTMATFSTLVEDGTYQFFGAFYNASENGPRRRRQVDDKVLKFESALAVKTAVGADAHIHPNVVFVDDRTQSVMELDAVVHLGGEGVANSTVYIVEAANAPQENESKVLSDKVETFKRLAANHYHFRDVNSVIPVLAGRHWSQRTVDAAKAAKQWRVVPSGAGYQIVRGLHCLVKRIVK